MPDFSVILPCYNTAKHIVKCLNSIFGNSRRTPYSLEVILIDDGSQDNLVEVLSDFFGTDLSLLEEKFVYNGIYVIFVKKRNGGVSDARNCGLNYASGKYIIFVDPDDYVLDNYFDYVYEHLKENILDILLLGFVYIKENAEGIQLSKRVVYPKREYLYRSNSEIMDNLLPEFLGLSISDVRNRQKGALLPPKEHAGVWRGIYRRDFLNEFDIRFDTSLKVGEDRIFNAMCMTKATAVDSISEAFYCYTVRTTGVFSQRNSVELLANKCNLLACRFKIVSELQRMGCSVGLELYAVSNILSVFELMNSIEFSRRKEIYDYLHHSLVLKSIKIMPYIGVMKFDFPLFLLKHNMSVALFAIIAIARKIGIKISA